MDSRYSFRQGAALLTHTQTNTPTCSDVSDALLEMPEEQ